MTAVVRYPRESQRAVVERVLREQGAVATFDVLYRMTDGDGHAASITRLAAIVCDLRADGWEIKTHDEHGALATYELVSEPNGVRRVPVVVWTCLECGQPATVAPEPALGGMGYGHCQSCHRARYFRALVA